MSDSAAVVREFLSLLESRRAAEAVELLAEDAQWRNSGLPTLRGRRIRRILLELPGYEPVPAEEVAATIGRVSVVRVSLRRIVGRVRVAGAVGTEVLVDRDEGEPSCLAPCELALEPGIHTIRGRNAALRFDPVPVRVEAA